MATSCHVVPERSGRGDRSAFRHVARAVDVAHQAYASNCYRGCRPDRATLAGGTMQLRGPTGQAGDQPDLEGRLFADRGPRRGPILWGHFPPVMNVFGTPDAAGEPIGTAYPQ